MDCGVEMWYGGVEGNIEREGILITSELPSVAPTVDPVRSYPRNQTFQQS